MHTFQRVSKCLCLSKILSGLRDALPSHFKPFVTFAYRFGWRDTEIAGLTWNQVERTQWIVRLEVGETKNDEARTVYLNKEYVAQWQDKFLAGPILHDFRRTAVGNMVRSGISERVAMMISGHKTRSVFDRYSIVSDADLRMAAQKQEC